MAAHLLEPFLAVFGVDHVIVVLQDHAENVAVDLLILHDQDQMAATQLF